MIRKLFIQTNDKKLFILFHTSSIAAEKKIIFLTLIKSHIKLFFK
jgi:hypothetical protein